MKANFKDIYDQICDIISGFLIQIELKIDSFAFV